MCVQVCMCMCVYTHVCVCVSVCVCVCVCYKVLQRGRTRCPSVKEKVWNKAVRECSRIRYIVRELATINTIENRLRN